MKRLLECGLVALACVFASSAAARSQAAPPNPDSLLARGRQLTFQNGPRQALPLFEQALPLFRSKHDTRGEALALGYIGYCYEQLSDYPHALEFLDQSLALKQRLGDRDEAGKTLNNLGLVYWDRANYARATDEFQQALQIARAVHDLRLEGAALNNLGLISDDQGRYDRSLPLFEQALRADRAAHFDRGVGDVLGNLGGDAQLLGQYREALKYYGEARALDERLQLKPNLSKDLVNLGLCRLGLGQPRQAIDEFNHAIALASQLGLKEIEADARKAKGTALLQLGRYDDARSEYHQAIQVYKAAGLNQRLLEALSDEGTLLADLGDAASAEADFNRAIDLARSIGHPRGVTTNMIALGDLQWRRARYDQASALYRQAYDAARRAKDQGAMAASLLQLSLTLRDQDKLQQARPGAEQALAIARATGAAPTQARALYVLAELDRRGGHAIQALQEYTNGNAIATSAGDTDLDWRCAYGKGQALEALHRDREALAAYRHAIEVIEGVRSLLSEKRFQAGYLQDKYQVYVAMVHLLLKLDQTGEAFLYSEKLRALSYRDITHQELAAQSPNATQLESRIRQLQSVLDGDSANVPSPRSREAKQAILSRLQAAEQRYQSLLDDLRSHHSRSAALDGLSVISARQLRAHLPSRSALLEYLVGADALTAFVLTRSSLHAITLPISAVRLRAKVELFRDLIADPRSDDWRAPAAALESLLIAPLDKPGWLKGVNRIYLVPNSVLYYLPFAALLRSTGNASRFLIEDYQLSYLPAAAAIAYGPPVVDRDPNLLALAPAESRLRYAQREAQSITALYSPHDQLLQGRAATKVAFERTAGSFQFVHLAAHGFFDQLNPIFSGVQLQPDGTDDGRLDVYEILRLHLHARLVTLAACDTALGSGYLNEFPAGDEFVGLTRAFLAAGSSSVLASLWSVDDRSTLLFMQRFYRSLRHAGEADALRQAQLALLRSGGPYSQPYYWAPFVLVEAQK